MMTSALLQPPPRGCVLKLKLCIKAINSFDAAASARLCVETLKQVVCNVESARQPPPRGCVLKLKEDLEFVQEFLGSRLRAAVC